MRTALRLALAVGLIFALLPLGVRAEQVNNWREGANYPAQITAIPIGDNKLTPNNSVRVGALDRYTGHTTGVNKIGRAEYACQKNRNNFDESLQPKKGTAQPGDADIA